MTSEELERCEEEARKNLASTRFVARIMSEIGPMEKEYRGVTLTTAFRMARAWCDAHGCTLVNVRRAPEA